MSVRKIKKNYRSLTGIVNSPKNDIGIQFESSLEKDFITVIEFDWNVQSYIEQPVEISYEENGIKKRYTPDFLVNYRKDTAPGKWMKPLLCEIKYQEELEKNWKLIKPKVKVAKEYAKNNGWDFKVLTEREIRDEYLYNAQFLLKYRDQDVDNGLFCTLLDAISELRLSTPEEIIVASAKDQNRRAQLLYALWVMIANGTITCDLTRKLTMKSEIFSNDYIPNNKP